MPPTTKKKVSRKTLKNRKTTVVFVTSFDAKDTLFPEKVAKANKMLRNAKILDPRFSGPGKI